MTVAARRSVLDGTVVRAWAAQALAACDAARERIDAVNVFPVPDSDTGSNVTLTVAGGADAVAATPADAQVTDLLTALAHGAARAARGNSGIILSQWLVGFAAGATGPDAAAADGDDVAGLVRALRAADAAARSAVPDPQEGTVLTVAREVAGHADRASRAPGDATAAAVLAAAVEAARGDLARLSSTHDVLRAAQVVDAGACALLVVLDALVAALRGHGGPVDLDWLPRAAPAAVAACGAAAGGAFEVMVLVRGSWPGGDGLAAALGKVGDAVAVVDAGDARHAHVHCDDPAAAVALVPAAEREQVVVRRVEEPPPGERGLVVVTPSPGLAAWYATAGAVTLVGAAVTPEQVARAAADTRCPRAVVVDAAASPLDADLPGDVDLLTAADDGSAVVACLALLAAADLDPAAGAAALERLQVAHPDGPQDVRSVLGAMLVHAHAAQGVTVVHGEDADPQVVRDLAAELADEHPLHEVVVAGPAAGVSWWVGVD